MYVSRGVDLSSLANISKACVVFLILVTFVSSHLCISK